MSVRNIAVVVIVLVAVAGVYLWRKGAVQVDGEGGVTLNTRRAANELKADLDKVEVSPYAKGDMAFTALRYEDALAAFKQGLKADPKNDAAPHARFRIAVCYKKLGQRGKAQKAYKAFLKSYPDHTQAASAKKQIEILSATQ